MGLSLNFNRGGRTMFKVCKTDNNKNLIKLKKNRLYNGSWINVINPTNEELEKIANWIKWDVDTLKVLWILTKVHVLSLMKITL